MPVRLGLDAQRQAVARHVGSGQLVAEYTDIESGLRHRNRPQLLAALGDCRMRRAVLLIARLDCLACIVAFIANLMESQTDFIACDMPQATRLTIHILAAVAEHEREMISARTKAALVEAKRRGTVLGNPRLVEATGVWRQLYFRFNDNYISRPTTTRFDGNARQWANAFRKTDLDRSRG